MDDLLLFLSEEIALEGDAGCNLPKLWSLVDTFYTRATQPPTHSTSTDDNLKRFLWPAIANMTDLTITLSDPSEHSKPPKKSTAAKKDKKLKEDKAIAPKSNVQASIASTPPSELEVTYSNRLRLVSSEEAQKNALLGQMDVNYIPSPTLMRVLASVARTRSVGTTQADMSKELGIDPRSLFHFVKTLCAKGLITKFPVVTKGFYTNLCIHMRYAPQNAAYMATQATIASAKSSQQTNLPLMSSTASNDPVVTSLNASSVSLSALESLNTTFFAGNSDFNVHQVSFHGELIRQKISDLLSASKTKIMVVEDLIDVVFGSNPSKKQRKWFNRTIGDMAEKNFLERVNVPKLTRGIDRCVRLLKLFVPKSEMKHEEEEDKDDIISDPENSDDEAGVSNQTDSISSFPKKRRQGLLADLPVEYQVYRLISMAGPSGITAGQIQSRLSNIYSRLLTKILTRLLKPPAAVGCSLLGVNRIAEFHGRERRYRYYLSNHFEAIQKQHGFSLVEDEVDVHETESQPAPNASIGKRRGSSGKIRNLELSESSTPAPSTPVKPRGKEWKTPAYNQPNIAAHGDEYVQLFSNVNVTPRQQRGQRVRGSDDEDSEPTTGRSSKRKARENLRKCVSHVLDETDDNENVMDDKSTDVDVDVEVEVETEDNTTCSVCNSPNDEELLLLCDGCEVAQHTYCAKTRLQTIPEGNWYCNGPNCKNPAADDTADGCDIVMEDAFRSSPSDDSLALPSSHGAIREITTEAEVPFSPDPGTHMTFTVLKRGAGKQAEIEVSPKSRRQMALHHQTAVQNNFDRIINGAGKSAAKTRKDGKQIIHNYNRSSITALQRKKILLQLLDEQQVVEVGYQLIRDYQECFKARYPEDAGKSTIDKKTFIRSANALEEDGLLRQYTIKMPLIHGGYTTKNLFLHRDLTPQSPEVKEYVMSIQDKALLVGGSYKPVKAPEVEQVEVERLNDLKYRLTNTMEGEHGPTATTSEISPPSPPKTLPSRGHPANPEFWMYAAQDFGWIPAKMIRAKLLHQWIASRFFNQNNKNEQESHGELQRRSFQSTLLFHDMPLEIYFQCIGHTQVNEELLEWVRKCPNPRQVKLIQLPNEIRQHIFSGNYKYRRNVKALIDILVALNVISPVWRDYETSQQASSHQMTITASTEALAPSYLLQPTVPMYDYSRPRCATTGNRVFIRNYSLATISDVSIFWSELQFVSQQSVTEATRQGDSDEEDGEGLSDSERSAPKSKTGQKNSIAKLALQDPLRCINAPRNWYSLYPFTTAQRRSLEEHVNRRTGKTPLDDEEIIKDLARKLEVIPFRVRNYFRKIESEYEKKAQNIKEKRNLMVLETERKKRAARTEGETADAEEGPHGDIRRRRRKNLSRRLRASADAARGTVPRLAPASTLAGTKRKRLEDDMPSSWGRKSQRRNSREGADDELLVCGEEERFRNQYEPISSVRRPRLSWSEEEDEKIIHAYVVLKIRARHSLRFAWSPAASMIPGRTPDNCRRRLTTMLKRPAVAARVELLMIHWEALRANMLATGELSEPPAHVAMDAETLKLHMKHLVDRSGKNMPSRPLAMLPSLKIPSTVADFYAYADYAYALPFDDEVFFEDGIESLPSSRAKIQTLYSYAFGLRAYLGDGAADTPVSEMEEGKTVSWVNRKIVKEVVKMILMTPEGRYDPTRAYQILARYPFADSTTGLEEAKEDGCIVKVRSGVGIDRRVPGRGYHVSDKFLTIMSGILPNRLLPRAAAYHERLVRQLSQENVGASCAEPHTELSPLITDSGMACWLNLMAARKIHAIPVFPGFEEQNLVPGNASRQVDRRKLDCKIFTSPQRDLGETLSREISTTLLSGLPHLLSAASIGSQKGTLSERRKEELDCLRWLIEEAGSEGATLAQLLEKMSRSYPNISAQEVRLYVSLLLTKPAEESPNGTRNAPVITCGVSTKRFVSSKYVGLWWVQTNASPQDRLAPPTAMLATAGSSEPASALLAEVYPRDEDVSMYSQPKMWFDISGNPVEPVLRGCMESLIGHVLTKPGISEANLYRKFSSVMSRLEMRDSLEELVVRRALRRTIMKRPERVSLFSKPRVYRIVGADEEIAEEERMSCYFVQENYYLKTSPIASGIFI